MSISLKALLAASVAVIVAAPAFADNADGQISGDITFYTHFANFVDNGRWDDWVAEFEEKYPGTNVEVIAVSNYRREMPVRFASGDYGDVLNVLDNLPPDDYVNY
jgi:raffinose/stachyose/melibiose transport system substrate-binding protein